MSLIEPNFIAVIQRAATQFPVELSSLLGITEQQLHREVSVIPKPTKHGLVKKLTSVMHLNEKLAESAMGCDLTLHEYMETELKNVINSIK